MGSQPALGGGQGPRDVCRPGLARNAADVSVPPVRVLPTPRPRVVAYVIRRLGDRIQLLVFDHEGSEGGTQVPAGGIRPAESRREAALREVKEQTGLGSVRVVTELGIIESPEPESGQSRQMSYWVLEAAGELPSDWCHEVAPDDGDKALVFLCRWEPLPLTIALLDGQGSLLGQLHRLFV